VVEGSHHSGASAVRFNDYHKSVCATLKLDSDQGIAWRTFMLRCFSQGLTANACLSLLKHEIQARDEKAVADGQAVG
jgi:hypothetical protein